MVINFKSLHELIMHVTCLGILLWNFIAVKIISFLKFEFEKHAKKKNVWKNRILRERIYSEFMLQIFKSIKKGLCIIWLMQFTVLKLTVKKIQKDMQGLWKLLNKSNMLLIGSLHIYASSNTLRAYLQCQYTLCQIDLMIKPLLDSQNLTHWFAIWAL